MDESALQLAHENTRLHPPYLFRDDSPPQTVSHYIAYIDTEYFDNITRAMETGQYSDLTFTLGTKKWTVHKVLVCPHSKVIRDLVAGGANEIDFLEGGLLSGEEDSPVVDAFVQCLYVTHYGWLNQEPEFSIYLHIKLFNLGIKYQVRDTHRLAFNAYSLSIKNLKDLEVYFKAVETVYNVPDTVHNEQLRGPIVSVAVVGSRRMMRDLGIRQRLHQLIADVPQFWADLTVALLDAGGVPGDQAPLCEDCGHNEELYKVELLCKTCKEYKSMEFR